jgi:hypothetical protein
MVKKNIPSRLPKMAGPTAPPPDYLAEDWLPEGHQRVSTPRGEEIDYWLGNAEGQLILARYVDERVSGRDTRDERRWHLFRLLHHKNIEEQLVKASPDRPDFSSESIVAVGELFALRPLRGIAPDTEVFIRWDQLEERSATSSFWHLTVSIAAPNSQNSDQPIPPPSDDLPF